MPRVNNVIQQVSQLNTYEQEKVFDFFKTVLMSNGITNSIDEEIAENRINSLTNNIFELRTYLHSSIMFMPYSFATSYSILQPLEFFQSPPK